jgi:hypothetical protein
MDLGEIGWSGVDWVCPTENRDKCRALVYAVMNVHVPYNAGKLSRATQLLAYGVVFSSIDLVGYVGLRGITFF